MKYVVTIVDTETGESEVLKGAGLVCNVFESEERVMVAIKNMNTDMAKRMFEATVTYMEQQLLKAETAQNDSIEENVEGGI